jgi:hypothetical protein
MNKDIIDYNAQQTGSSKEVCERLAKEIMKGLPKAENKVWHASPVWFLDGNPVVGYAVRKDNVQLLFWSGQSFDEPDLEVEGTFKAAQKRYAVVSEINTIDLQRWLKKSAQGCPRTLEISSLACLNLYFH